MTKEEFVAMSLLTRLKVSNNYNPEEINDLNGIRVGTYFIDNDTKYAYGDIKNCRPILHPLSDLTKEIEHEGKKFVPMDLCEQFLDTTRRHISSEFKNMAKHNYFDGYLPFNVCNELIKWHFDISGLIDKGEAIDVNTPPVNPYK